MRPSSSLEEPSTSRAPHTLEPSRLSIRSPLSGSLTSVNAEWNHHCLEAFLAFNKEHRTSRDTPLESVWPQTPATGAATECEHKCSFWSHPGEMKNIRTNWCSYVPFPSNQWPSPSYRGPWFPAGLYTQLLTGLGPDQTQGPKYPAIIGNLPISLFP